MLANNLLVVVLLPCCLSCPLVLLLLPTALGQAVATARCCAEVVSVMAMACCWCAVLATSWETVEISPSPETWDCSAVEGEKKLRKLSVCWQ